MKILTVQQPWAHWLMEGLKPVENRSWLPKQLRFGERFGIHSSAAPSSSRKLADMFSDMQMMIDSMRNHRRPFPGRDQHVMVFGSILGTVQFDGAVTDALITPGQRRLLEPWYFGPCGWVVSKPQKLITPIRIRGQLGLWDHTFALDDVFESPNFKRE